MTESKEVILMDRDRVGRSIKRIAYQIAENNRQDKQILLIGIGKRGYIFARELATVLSSIYSTEVPLTEIPKNDEESEISNNNKLKNIEDRYVVLADDVIFSGSTMFKALTRLSDLRVNELHTAVLIDRGHRKFPVEAHFVGLEQATKLDEHVSVKIEKNRISHVVLEVL